MQHQQSATISLEHQQTAPHIWPRLSEAARPDRIRLHPKAHYFALAAVCIGAFMGQLDASIITIALPTVQNIFHASLGAVAWVGLSYALVLVVGVVAFGRMGDMVGRKLLYIYGFALFVIGSLCCAFAPNLWSLVACRAMQAVGAAMFQANSVAIVTLVMPRKSLRTALGIQGAAQALGLSLGPVIGGVLLSTTGWRSIFLVNVPIGCIAIAAAWVFLPRSRELQPRTRFDWAGFGCFGTATGAFFIAVSFGNNWAWQSWRTLSLFGMSFVAGAVFIQRERHAVAPMVAPALFKLRAFTSGISSGLLAYLVFFGVMFAVPYFFEHAYHWSTLHAGVSVAVVPLCFAFGAIGGGQIAANFRWRPPFAMCMTAVSLFVLGITHVSEWALFVCLGTAGLGLGLFMPSNNGAVMSASPRSHVGCAGGVVNMTRGLGTSLGLAIVGIIFGAKANGGIDYHHAFSLAMTLLGAGALVGVLVASLGLMGGASKTSTIEVAIAER